MPFVTLPVPGHRADHSATAASNDDLKARRGHEPADHDNVPGRSTT